MKVNPASSALGAGLRVRVQGLSKAYQGKGVLKKVSFSVEAGEIVAFLGPNGAGKSTTIRILMGLEIPDVGQVEVLGASPRDLRAREKLGYTSQDLSYPPLLKVGEILRWVRGHFSQADDLADLIERFGLGKILGQKVAGLSGGEMRRLGLACALIGRPDLLVLDEPTTGLDVEARRRLWAELKSFKDAGGAVLLSTHDLAEASAVADRVLLLNDGEVLFWGTMDEIVAQVDVKRVSYRLKGEMVSHLVSDADSLIRQIVRDDVPFEDLSVRHSSLEEAFLHLQGGVVR